MPPKAVARIAVMASSEETAPGRAALAGTSRANLKGGPTASVAQAAWQPSPAPPPAVTPVGSLAAIPPAGPRSTLEPIAGSARIVEAALVEAALRDAPDPPPAPRDRLAAPSANPLAASLPPAFDVIAMLMLTAPARH